MARLGKWTTSLSRQWRLLGAIGLLLAVTIFASYGHAQTVPNALKSADVTGAAPAPEAAGFHYFSFMDPTSNFTNGERAALFGSLCVALMALAYAGMLVKQVVNADKGTKKMQEIAAAVREGANAYLGRQFRVVGILIVVLVVVLFFSKYLAYAPDPTASAVKTPAPSLSPSISPSAAAGLPRRRHLLRLVGFVGMRMATIGNLRVAAAAPVGFGKALMLGYRSGTITGMMTDGLGLLGGTLIFMMYGEHAYEALLGFGFGGTLLALFMRVGGGIYTKAADVGADLVGKIEKDIPEDDPRNAATIADNVGDNVGDCAGMAADIFESYEVTIVAAMILGLASFGHKGVMFPILVRAIGVIGSIISTYTVRARPRATSPRP